MEDTYVCYLMGNVYCVEGESGRASTGGGLDFPRWHVDGCR